MKMNGNAAVERANVQRYRDRKLELLERQTIALLAISDTFDDVSSRQLKISEEQLEFDRKRDAIGDKISDVADALMPTLQSYLSHCEGVKIWAKEGRIPDIVPPYHVEDIPAVPSLFSEPEPLPTRPVFSSE